MRTIPALLVTVGLAAALTGCATVSGDGTASSCIAPGKASEAVTATGKAGSQPKVSVPEDLTTTGTQVSVLRQGDGRRIGDGTPTLIEYTVVDGQTGKTVQSSGYGGQSAPITAGSSNAGEIGKAIECANVGDRLAVVTSRSALSGGSASTKPGQDAAVVVIDVVKAFDSRATGTPQLAGDGMPAVVLAPDGAPGITVPSGNPPKSGETHLLRKGHGAELTAKDTALVKYIAVTWGGAESTVAGSSWTDGSGAVTVPLQKGGQIQDGIRDALDGSHVGDQVLVVVEQAGTSYAYVFDVLGALPR